MESSQKFPYKKWLEINGGKWSYNNPTDWISVGKIRTFSTLSKKQLVQGLPGFQHDDYSQGFLLANFAAKKTLSTSLKTNIGYQNYALETGDTTFKIVAILGYQFVRFRGVSVLFPTATKVQPTSGTTKLLAALSAKRGSNRFTSWKPRWSVGKKSKNSSNLTRSCQLPCCERQKTHFCSKLINYPPPPQGCIDMVDLTYNQPFN